MLRQQGLKGLAQDQPQSRLSLCLRCSGCYRNKSSRSPGRAALAGWPSRLPARPWTTLLSRIAGQVACGSTAHCCNSCTSHNSSLSAARLDSGFSVAGTAREMKGPLAMSMGWARLTLGCLAQSCCPTGHNLRLGSPAASRSPTVELGGTLCSFRMPHKHRLVLVAPFSSLVATSGGWPKG